MVLFQSQATAVTVTWLLVFGALGFLLGNVIGDPLNTRWALGLLALSYPVFRWIPRGRVPVG